MPCVAYVSVAKKKNKTQKPTKKQTRLWNIISVLLSNLNNEFYQQQSTYFVVASGLLRWDSLCPCEKFQYVVPPSPRTVLPLATPEFIESTTQVHWKLLITKEVGALGWTSQNYRRFFFFKWNLSSSLLLSNTSSWEYHSRHFCAYVNYAHKHL